MEGQFEVIFDTAQDDMKNILMQAPYNISEDEVDQVVEDIVTVTRTSQLTIKNSLAEMTDWSTNDIAHWIIENYYKQYKLNKDNKQLDNINKLTESRIKNIIPFSRFKQIHESFTDKNKKNGILIIVDVQKEFEQFIPQGYVEKLTDYCNQFETVYQIWDSNKADKPSYHFPNEKGTYEKNYGTQFDAKVKEITNDLKVQYPNAPEEQLFKLKDEDAYLVRVKNNHGWFYCNPGLTEFFRTLKGKSLKLAGGADNECLRDVNETLQAFDVQPVYVDKIYLYSAKTSNTQQI